MILKLPNKTLLIFLMGILLCIPVIIPFFHSGFFPSHDGEWAVVRAGEMFRELRDIQFPPRYSGSLNFGYGYPLFNFAYPFPYYVSTLIHSLGFEFVSSIKIIFASSVLLSFTGIFLLSRKFWGNNTSALFSGVLYVYLPYRLVDLYVRGSIGESISFALYPFIIYFLLLILEKKKRNIAIITSSALFAFLITAHNISAVYFGIMYLAFLAGAYFSKERKSIPLLLAPLILGALLSLYFWGVALFEKNNILLSMVPISDRNLYFSTFPKLFYSSWGYGTPTDSNPFTYSLGIPQILGFIISIFAVFKLKSSPEKNIFIAFIIVSVIFIFMMFPVSSFIWKLSLLSDINYPWTLLLPLGFLFSFLSGGLVKHIKKGIYLGIGLGILSILLYISYARPSEYVYRGDNFYLTNEATTTSSNELMPLWVKAQPIQRFENKIEGVSTNDLSYKSNTIKFNSSLNSGKTATINQVYYPGWKAYVNGKETNISYNNNFGVMKINVPSGSNSITLRFTETPFRLFTDLVSLVSLIFLAVFALSSLLKGHFKRKRV